MKRRIRSPHAVMLLVIAAYAVKVLAKYLVGSYANSSALLGDAWHNFSDIIAAAFVIVAVLISRIKRPEYPFGLHKVESIFSVATGALLGYVAVADVAAHGCAALLSGWAAADAWTRSVLPLPAFEPVRLGRSYMLPLLAVTLGGAACSWFVGGWQIGQGRASGHESIVSDGKETRTDGIAEIGIAAGAIIENVLKVPWLDGLVTLGVAFFIGETALKISRRGLRSLMLKSIGKETEADLKKAIEFLPGIIEAAKLRTFFSGPSAIVIVKIISRCPLLAQRDLKLAIEAVTVPVLAKHDISHGTFYIRFALPAEDPHRIAIGVCREGGFELIAPTPADISSVLICDLSDGRLKKVKAEDPTEDLAALLRKKRVLKLYCSDEPDSAWSERLGLPVERSAHRSLASFGL